MFVNIDRDNKSLLGRMANSMGYISYNNILSRDIHEKRISMNSQLVRTNFTSCLVKKPFLIEECSTADIDKLLKTALRSADSRRCLLDILGRGDIITHILQRALSTSNGLVRMENPITDLAIILEAIRSAETHEAYGKELVKNKFNHNKLNKLALAGIILKFLKVHKLVTTDVEVEAVTVNRATESLKESVINDLYNRLIDETINSIYFKKITVQGNTTNLSQLVSLFMSDLTSFRTRLIHLNSVAQAYNSLLPRIKAVLTNQVHANYQEVELSFVNNAAFNELCGNIDLAIEALNDEVALRPTTPSYTWLESDTMVLSAINNSIYYDKVDITSFRSYFTIQKVYNKFDRLRYVTVSKNLNTPYEINCYWRSYINSCQLVTNFNALDGFLAPVNKWHSKYNTSNLNIAISDLLLRYGDDSDNIGSISLMLRASDILKLAVSFSHEVFLDPSKLGTDKMFVFSLNSSVNKDLSKLASGSLQTYETNQPYIALLLGSVNQTGTNSFSIPSLFKLRENVRYIDTDLFLKDLKESKETLVVNLIKTINSDKLFTYKEETSLLDMLNLDYGYDIYITNATLARPVISLYLMSGFIVHSMLLREIAAELGISLSRITSKKALSTTPELLQKAAQLEDMIVLWYAKLIGPMLADLSDNAEFKSISSKVTSLIRSKAASDGNKELSHGSLYHDKVYSRQIEYYTTMYILKSIGLLSNTNLDSSFNDLIDSEESIVEDDDKALSKMLGESYFTKTIDYSRVENQINKIMEYYNLVLKL